MKIVFFGTPDYVLPVLKILYKYHDVVAVVTQPPRPVGRSQIPSYSPVDEFAHKHNIPIYFDAEKIIKDKIIADFGVLESYGDILSKEVINYFPLGIINIHPSLLPRWRGAAPVPATIISGDNITGGTLIKLDEQIDHGPIISTFKEDVLPTDTTETLRQRVFKKSAGVLLELISPYAKRKISLKKQDDKTATFTTRINKKDGFIPPDILLAAMKGKGIKKKWIIEFIEDSAHIPISFLPTPQFVGRFIRAMDPWPVAWTTIQINKNNSKRLKLLKAYINDAGALIPDIVQLEGKNPVSWKQFKEAHPHLAFSS